MNIIFFILLLISKEMFFLTEEVVVLVAFFFVFLACVDLFARIFLTYLDVTVKVIKEDLVGLFANQIDLLHCDFMDTTFRQAVAIENALWLSPYLVNRIIILETKLHLLISGITFLIYEEYLHLVYNLQQNKIKSLLLSFFRIRFKAVALKRIK